MLFRSQRISIHAPHTGRDNYNIYDRLLHYRFQSTRPIRGATLLYRVSLCNGEPISIHAPHTGRDAGRWRCQGHTGNFNPRAPYGARRNVTEADRNIAFISIHAPHTGRDAAPPCISIKYSKFQSTRPIRGATIRWYTFEYDRIHFNPRAPYGARRPCVRALNAMIRISIHAPHTGRDGGIKGVQPRGRHFNPRAPYGARQQKCIIYVLHFCNNRQSKHKTNRKRRLSERFSDKFRNSTCKSRCEPS